MPHSLQLQALPDLKMIVPTETLECYSSQYIACTKSYEIDKCLHIAIGGSSQMEPILHGQICTLGRALLFDGREST